MIRCARVHRIAPCLCVLVGTMALGGLVLIIGTNSFTRADEDDMPARVFEMRTYITHEGKLDALHARFRDHTTKLFEKHGMSNVGYWTPADGPEAGNTLVYILAYPSREAREQSWQAFLNDPEWQRAKAESEQNGPLVEKVVSQFLLSTDYSAIQ